MVCAVARGVAMGRITVFSGVERRRRWGDDEKLAMVESSLVPGGSVARIARERDVAPLLICKRWLVPVARLSLTFSGTPMA